MKQTHRTRPGRLKPISLHGLSFDEAVGDLLRVKPPAKPKKRPAKKKKQLKS